MSITFEERARRLYHDVSALLKGVEIDSQIAINDVGQLRDVLDDGATPDERQVRGKRISARSSPNSVTQEAVLNRVLAYVLGNEDLNADDRRRIQAVFPMTIRAISNLEKTLQPGEVWDLGTSSTPVTVNLGTLTMMAGSSIRIQNTVLTFTADSVIRQSGPGGPNYDMALFGATGPTGGVASSGGVGGAGAQGSPGTCSSPGVAGNDGGPGGQGKTGATGGVGSQGGDGLAALTATIRVAKSLGGDAGQFVVLTQSGTGGSGGPGGTGGTGGPGGNGGDGASCGCEGTNGGNGGDGGSGGSGGTGATGGNGTDGQDIYVYVPAASLGKIKTVLNTVPAGLGGVGGPGGSGGAGGNAGGGGKHHSGGGNGGTGSSGSPGPNGPSGSRGGNPGQIFVASS
jgi:hypothetical protein